jgi:hypothetical protein
MLLRDVLTFAGAGAAGYMWLSAIVAPLWNALRSCVRERRRRAFAVLALACAAAVLWTAVPLALLFLAMMLEPRAGLALLQEHAVRPGFVAGLCAWTIHLGVASRAPRFGDTFEAATAIAVVAAVDDDARTLARVEAIYRALAIEGSRNVKTAPPSGPFEAWTSPPWRRTIARTIESPRPLPEGTRVPARDASTL